MEVDELIATTAIPTLGPTKQCAVDAKDNYDRKIH